MVATTLLEVIMENYFKNAAVKIYDDAKKEKRLAEGLTLDGYKALALAQDGVVQTHMGSVAADSEPMSRSAPHTGNNIDSPFGEEEKGLARQAVENLSRQRITCVDTIVGDGRDGITARFIMPEIYTQLAYGLKLLFGQPAPRVVEEPTYTIIFFTDKAFRLNKQKKLVDKDISIRLWMGDKRGDQVKICRNSIYLGEGKKGVFQFEDWRVKTIDRTGLFLHAGARRDCLWIYDLETERPEMKEVVMGVSGLTATGKTTTLCRKFAKLPREHSEMIGDDGGSLAYDGSYSAFECGGLYVKTEGLDPSQPEILRAAESREAFLENVAISKYPYMPDFLDTKKTANGRAVISRKNLEIASPSLNANRLDYVIILTRNPLVNAINKLTPEQATMQFIYGESIESSGGNPEEAGRFKRVFFLDPFMCGNKLEHAMIFYEILKKSQIKCYLANTGAIGQDEVNVSLRQSLAIYNDLARIQLKFSFEPDYLGYHYPIKSDRANMDVMRAENLFSDRDILINKARDFLKGRRDYLEDFETKNGEIPEHIKESLPYRPEQIEG